MLSNCSSWRSELCTIKYFTSVLILKNWKSELIFSFFFFCNYKLTIYFRAIRHPASGYVQGINDLVTPFLIIFLSEHLQENMDKWSISELPPSIFSNIEADCYWCLTKLLDGMQDHYTFSQPGIQRLVFKLKELVSRINGMLILFFFFFALFISISLLFVQISITSLSITLSKLGLGLEVYLSIAVTIKASWYV